MRAVSREVQGGQRVRSAWRGHPGGRGGDGGDASQVDDADRGSGSPRRPPAPLLLSSVRLQIERRSARSFRTTCCRSRVLCQLRVEVPSSASYRMQLTSKDAKEGPQDSRGRSQGAPRVVRSCFDLTGKGSGRPCAGTRASCSARQRRPRQREFST